MTGRRVALALAALVAACTPAACGGGAGAGAPGAEAITVAAASDLRPAFTELARRFEARDGVTVTLSFGSSGQLAQQIRNGAPFDLFASAAAGYVDEVIAAGRGDAATRTPYAHGRVVVWSRDRERRLADLDDPSLRAVAIANPEHAPYGVAADQALRHAGVRAALDDRLVLGENVSDTLRLAQSGNADAAVVALSLALATPGGHWTTVDASAHAPLEQVLVVTATGSAADRARRFAAFVVSAEGREVLRRWGLAEG